MKIPISGANTSAMRVQHHHKPVTMSTTAGPTVQIKVALTSNVYRRSAPHLDRPQLVVTNTLLTPSSLTVEIRGETDSGTIVTDDGFRAEHFNFFDLTTSKPVVHDLFPGTCDPWDCLEPFNVKELDTSKPNVVRKALDHVSPYSDPVNILEIGHEYRLTLHAQKVRCWDQSVAEIFGDREYLPREEIPVAMEVLLACDDELLLKVEA